MRFLISIDVDFKEYRAWLLGLTWELFYGVEGMGCGEAMQDEERGGGALCEAMGSEEKERYGALY